MMVPFTTCTKEEVLHGFFTYVHRGEEEVNDLCKEENGLQSPISVIIA